MNVREAKLFLLEDCNKNNKDEDFSQKELPNSIESLSQ